MRERRDGGMNYMQFPFELIRSGWFITATSELDACRCVSGYTHLKTLSFGMEVADIPTAVSAHVEASGWLGGWAACGPWPSMRINTSCFQFLNLYYYIFLVQRFFFF